MGYFHVASAFPQEPDNVQEESDASAANTSPGTHSTRNGAGQEQSPQLLGEREAGHPVHGSAQRQSLAAFVNPGHGKRASQKQLQPTHPISF